MDARQSPALRLTGWLFLTNLEVGGYGQYVLVHQADVDSPDVPPSRAG